MNKMLVAGAVALSFAACSKESAAAPSTPPAEKPAAGAPVANAATAQLDLGQSI